MDNDYRQLVHLETYTQQDKGMDNSPGVYKVGRHG